MLPNRRSISPADRIGTVIAAVRPFFEIRSEAPAKVHEGFHDS